jgi:predicted hydrocarbon binding protein
VAGKRLGAWVFKRDFSLGAKFDGNEFIKRVVLPASAQIANISAEDSTLYVERSPLSSDEKAHGCRFFSGLFEGLGNEAHYLGRVVVAEKECCSRGAARCSFRFQYR